eukprot:TRINITY_DN546_c0_g1_i1.p1 TRINITY_DN546_c0_g1~~TRINITY_DN546_c0_g1_i1.p1  ORF type:complete len:357 (-),score=41.84 TRINITY_DN546_c0_g1_i1:205-1275(-)
MQPLYQQSTSLVQQQKVNFFGRTANTSQLACLQPPSQNTQNKNTTTFSYKMSQNGIYKEKQQLQCEERLKFIFNPEEVQKMLVDNGCSESELLGLLINPASKLARPPISDFKVGAVGLGISGAIYVGVNLEFGGLPLYHSVHAEQFLIVNALHHYEKAINLLAITAAPCGHCRQFCAELACADDIRFMFGDEVYSLEQILPHRFGPKDLLDVSRVPLLLQPQNHRLIFEQDAQEVINQRADDQQFQQAAQIAIKEARQSYAPYSKCPSGVSVITIDGDVYGGGCIESAAFNPSLSPLQTALIGAVIDGIPCYKQVKEVVVAELRDGKVGQGATTKLALTSMAPSAKVTMLFISWEK